MSEAAASGLKKALECQHGGKATFVQALPVKEMHGSETAWEGVVHVFDLADHPKADRAYAWSYELENGNRRFFAVLKVPPIITPRDAVRAAIVAEAQATK